MTLRRLRWGLTSAGETIAKFDDRAGNRCSIQASERLAPPPTPRGTKEAVIYLGVDGHRMTLARERVEHIRDALSLWLAEGVLPGGDL